MSSYNAFAKSILLTILAIIVIVASINPQSAPIKSDLTFSAVMGALGGIFIIVLLVERLTEIIITIWRESDSKTKKFEIESLKAEITESPDSDQSSKLERKQKALTNYQSDTKGIALFIGFSVSILVCAAGIGLLDSIVDIPKDNGFLRAVDIILTSGLIAGGSDSFHQFVRTIETFFKESRKRMTENA